MQGFRNDYTLSTTQEDQHKTTRPVTCQQCCEGREAVTYCLTCSHLCEECLEAHKKLKICRNHELMSEDGHQLAANESTLNRNYNCTIHPKDILNLYCRDCYSLGCVHCFVASHNGHDIIVVDDEKREETRREVEEVAKDYKKKVELKLKEFEQNLMYVTTIETRKTEKLATLKTDINNKVDSTIAQIEARRSKLLTEVEEIFKKISNNCGNTKSIMTPPS